MLFKQEFLYDELHRVLIRTRTHQLCPFCVVADDFIFIIIKNLFFRNLQAQIK